MARAAASGVSDRQCCPPCTLSLAQQPLHPPFEAERQRHRRAGQTQGQPPPDTLCTATEGEGDTLSSDLVFENAQASNAALPLRVLSTLVLWQRRMASRRQLARLDSRLLADAGISESQRYEELSKPFWR